MRHALPDPKLRSRRGPVPAPDVRYCLKADLPKAGVELSTKVRQAPARAPRLHPNLAELYRKKVDNLRGVLDEEDTRPEATNIVRDLVEEIRLHPEGKALNIELVGDLARILSFANEHPRRNKTAGVEVTLVAGARNRLYLLLFAPNLPLVVT